MKFLMPIINFIFPTRCVLCNTQGPDICKLCLQHLEHAKPSNHHWIISGFNYRDERVEQLMRLIKNKPHHRVVRILTRDISKRIPFPTADMIIPIPIHRSRFIERGYNQSLLIAQSFSTLFAIPLVSKVLIKPRKTKKQGTMKSRADRIKNLENSFTIQNKKIIQGKTILLVDDITTTGSTLIQAKDVLLAAGAKEVTAYTLAN